MLQCRLLHLSPKYISTEDVSEEYKAHEKEILIGSRSRTILRWLVSLRRLSKVQLVVV